MHTTAGTRIFWTRDFNRGDGTFAALGDVNNDGYADFAAGDEDFRPGGTGWGGQVRVVYGAEDGLGLTLDIGGDPAR